MDQVDWKKAEAEWKPSTPEAVRVEQAKINLIIAFCRYVAENLWNRIEHFEGNPEEGKKQLATDGLSKNEVFELAAKQIEQHGLVWAVVQKKFPDRLSYEFPLVVKVDEKFRYMKFQIVEGVKGLASPSKVKKVWLRYHVSSQDGIEVVYVEK